MKKLFLGAACIAVAGCAAPSGPIEASKEFYGSANELIPLMAQEARNIGADAIISMQTGQKIGLWAWSRPYGMGTAIKLENKADLNCVALGGEMK